MKKYLMLGTAILGPLFSSCYYDPFVYGNTSASFGVSSFGGNTATSFFVSTGDPRWAYDPYRFAYFDRFRGAYYDPFLFGFYPVGFVPAPIIGCPHPFGWSGVGVCPPPRNIRVRTLSRYDNRISNYQAANYHWARRVSSAGDASWISTNERNQLTRQASLAQPAPTTRSWQNGSLNRGSSSPMIRSTETPQVLGGSSFTSGNQSNLRGGNRTRAQNPVVMPQTFSNQVPTIQPSPSTSGMYGGLNRSQAQRSSDSSPRSTAMRAPAPSAPPAIAPAPSSRSSRSAPAPTYSSDSSSSRSSSSDSGYASPGGSGFSSPGGFRSGGGSFGGSSGGGGLRQFQR